jgi:hypothetical protein
MTWRPFGVSATIVDMRFGLPDTLTVYASGRCVSLPSVSTDNSRRWSWPNEWSAYRVPVPGAYARDLAVPLRPSTGFPVGQTSSSVSRPSSPTAKLDTELSPPFVVNRKRRSGERMTLPAPSKAFGELSWPLVGLNVPEPSPPVETRSTSSIPPFAERR